MKKYLTKEKIIKKIEKTIRAFIPFFSKKFKQAKKSVPEESLNNIPAPMPKNAGKATSKKAAEVPNRIIDFKSFFLLSMYCV